MRPGLQSGQQDGVVRAASIVATTETGSTAVVVSGLLLVWFLDHPYENRNGSIKPDEMERQLVIVEAEQASAPQLCETQGHPVSGPAAALRPARSQWIPAE